MKPIAPREHPRPWFFLLSAGVFFATVTGGCQIIGKPGSRGPGSDAPEFGQGAVYQGILSIDGGDLPAALELIREGGRDVRGALQASSGLMADGKGRIRGVTLRLELTYGGECPGRMLFEGEWNQALETFEGVLHASDCTGRSEGTFRFSTS